MREAPPELLHGTQGPDGVGQGHLAPRALGRSESGIGEQQVDVAPQDGEGSLHGRVDGLDGDSGLAEVDQPRTLRARRWLNDSATGDPL